MVNQTGSVTINQNGTRGTGKSRNLTKGVFNNFHRIWLNIGYRIMLKRSDGTQEEITTLNTFPVRGGVAHQTHTNGKHLGYNYFDELTG